MVRFDKKLNKGVVDLYHEGRIRGRIEGLVVGVIIGSIGLFLLL
jgi:hypothetical protein